MFNPDYYHSLRFGSAVLGAAALVLLTMAGSAYATGAQVMIVNGTSNHCLPYLSCYKPYEVDISPGGTVTWTNDDNATHTATAGDPNNGPVGLFDSGPILPGNSYRQFFGTIGRYPYYDKTDSWPSGVVVVSNQGPAPAEIGWVNGSLAMSSPGGGSPGLVLTKQVENTGGSDASPVLFRLRILNDSGFLFYDTVQRGAVPARNNATVSFTWDNPQPGNYRLNFDAENLAKQSNENTEFSSDLISVSNGNSSKGEPITTHNYSINTGNVAVPEFGPVSLAVLLAALVAVVAVSSRTSVKIWLSS